MALGIRQVFLIDKKPMYVMKMSESGRHEFNQCTLAAHWPEPDAMEPTEDKMEVTEDKRRRMRIQFETQVFLRFDDRDTVLEAYLKNISMNGIFVETGEAIDLHAPCRVEVILNAANSRLTMETQGRVCRHEDSGLGIEFANDIEWFALFSIFEPYGKRHPNNA